MEFGLLAQMPMFGDRLGDPAAEHAALRLDLELGRTADACGFKYIFCAEHHSLSRYSHLSASESFIPYLLAQTERIHVGSGIWPLNPVTNHPVRLAERAAMCDLLSQGRFEFGTGRGAGSWEVGTFGLDPSETKAVWDEVIREFVPMWESTDPRMSEGPGYSHDGPSFSVPPRAIHPKPYGGPKTHPPLWCAVGNLPTFEKAARHGMGALGFGFLVSGVAELQPYVEIYKNAIATAEPVGQYVNDNFLISTLIVCMDDAKAARQAVCDAELEQLLALVFYYHDTFPKAPGVRVWPDVPPKLTLSDVDALIDAKMIVCGDPDEVIEQLQGFQDIGVDTIVTATPNGMPRELALESVRVLGERVASHFDKDPVHRTSRMRYGADAERIVGDPERGARPFDSTRVSRPGVLTDASS